MFFVQEAVWLSSKASQMGTVKLHAVVKEDIDNEIEDFREFFKGDIHLDEKVGQIQTFEIFLIEQMLFY